MNLLVDIGNSRMKWAAAEQHHLSAGNALSNGLLNADSLETLWRNLPAPEKLLIACVSAHRLADAVQNAAKTLWPGIAIIEAKSAAQGFGVVNAYREPEKLGVDRWLALIAARNYYDLPICVVDCGTAITVDLLDASGRHLGGMICPGLHLMKKSLSAGTQALAYDHALFAVEPADATAPAIHSGVLSAAAGLVEHVLSRQKGPRCKLLLTGGDANVIAEHIDYNYRIDIDLVLRGLCLLGH